MEGKGEKEVRRKWYERLPHTYVILFILIVIGAILTWALPSGQFDREIVPGSTRAQVVPGSYHYTESEGVGVFGLLKAIPQGMDGACQIIFMIM